VKRIESRDNAAYRQWKALRQGREGRLNGQVFLEGYRLCGDALLSGIRPDTALIGDSALATPAGQTFAAQLPPDVVCYSLPDRLLAALCATEHPQGVALICPSPLLDEPAGSPAADGLYLVAEAIRDPGNLGNMIRIADAFAFDAVLLTDGTVYPFNDKVLRAAMGSCFHIPLIRMPDVAAVVDWLASGSVPVPLLAADPAEDAPAADRPASRENTWPVPAALLIGNEASGISTDARQLCRRRVAIPMPGRAESLNAAAATAILCYELMQARLHIRANTHRI
jgi:RNA methyltransferase, TrmH family